jgi:glycosyltransferase involved in cell wall biosynthesis/peptidoglycan/xylan/chitin deacetylase (PgdA/CDA1 family)
MSPPGSLFKQEIQYIRVTMVRNETEAQSTGAPPSRGQRVLVLAQRPPPVHGVTMTTARVANCLEARTGTEVEHLWAGSARTLSDVDGASFAKLAAFAGLNLRLAVGFATGRRYDAVYVTLAPWTHAAVRDALVAWWGKRLGSRTLVHLHGEGLDAVLDGKGSRNRLMRWLLSGTELIAITAKAAGVAEASRLFSRVVRLPNAAPDPGPPKPRGGGPLRLGFLGNLDPRKGVLRFVETIEHLAAADWAVEAVIAGGETRYLGIAELQARLAERGLSERVTVIGPVHDHDKEAFLAGLDVLVYLSHHDHAPLVLIEALAHGVVPVALDTGGVGEIIGPDLADHVLPGDLAEPDRSRRIAHLLEPYRQSSASLERDRRAARERYLSTYTESLFAERFGRILELPPVAHPPVKSLEPSGGPPISLGQVRSALPKAIKGPAVSVVRGFHRHFMSRPLPDRIAIYMHELEPADLAALDDGITTLRTLGYRTVTMDEYVTPGTQGKILTVSFDDNYASWHRSLPALDAMGLKATFYVNTLPFRDICPPGEIDRYFDRLDFSGERVPLSRRELQEISAAGHVIGSHSHSHVMLAGLERASWHREIAAPKALLEDLIGQTVVHFSWPYGMPRHMTEAQRDYALSAGYRTLAAATPAMLHRPRLEPRAVQRSGWSRHSTREANLAALAIDGRAFTRITGRSVIG